MKKLFTWSFLMFLPALVLAQHVDRIRIYSTNADWARTFLMSEIDSIVYDSEQRYQSVCSGEQRIQIPIAQIDSVVLRSEEPSYLQCPDDAHPHAIDLGLPSGTKWACCNIGASAPEGYGGYYAWGETSEKSNYSMNDYAYYNSSTGDFISIGSDIAGTGYDVAHVKWGGSWQMPTHDQQVELIDNCTSEWTKVKGVNGRKFTGPNGGIVFLPAAGYHWHVELFNAGTFGYCWSSTQYPSDSYGAYRMYFNSARAYWSFSSFSGLSVRAVLK